MIFGCEKLFYQPNWEISSLVKRNNHLKGKKGKRSTGNCLEIFALFFQTFMPKIHNLPN